jgi:hypothetical protein
MLTGLPEAYAVRMTDSIACPAGVVALKAHRVPFPAPQAGTPARGGVSRRIIATPYTIYTRETLPWADEAAAGTEATNPNAVKQISALSRNLFILAKLQAGITK